VFVGGPVSRESMIGLARLRPGACGFDGCQPIVGRLANVDLHLTASDVESAVEAVRLFSGYAGWDGGQLDAEIAAGGWYVLPSELDDAFTDNPTDLWADVLRRQGGRLALYAKAPPKLSMN
jgi:putative transcriptional regulator